MPELIVKLDDGRPVPLKDCRWVRFDPTGCAVGSLMGTEAATVEQAHKEFTSRQRDRERELRSGYRHELIHRSAWERTVRACFVGECQHRQEAAA